MKSFITLYIFSFLITAFTTQESKAQLQSIKNIITDPAISRRCKAMLKDRSEKIQVQQKINALLMRNEKLQRRARPTQKLVKQELTLNHTRLENNLRLTKFRIKSMEEDIIRKGCPGISI